MLWICMSWIDANPCCHQDCVELMGFIHPKPRMRRIHTGLKSHPGIFLLLGERIGTRHGTAGAVKPRPCTGLALFPKKPV